MLRKFPKLDSKGYGRIKYYLTNPPENIEPDEEIRYHKIYDSTIGYLKVLNDDLIDDLIYLYKDVKGISELIYEMYGFTQLTHYILFRFNEQRKKYYLKNNLKLPDLNSIF